MVLLGDPQLVQKAYNTLLEASDTDSHQAKPISTQLREVERKVEKQRKALENRPDLALDLDLDLDLEKGATAAAKAVSVSVTQCT